MKRLACLSPCLLMLTTVCLTPVAAAPMRSVSFPSSSPSRKGIPRFPDVSATHIAFLYAGELWIVPREGGTAVPLTKESGPRSSPKFSPNGRTLAFTGVYDAIYTVPVEIGRAHV